ncbi:MAG: hypothetical protein HC860_15845 [Alkalinema sp. RU_4_3]|nr:hypothetical protein [Alkalinema sp. RU_4_3]
MLFGTNNADTINGNGGSDTIHGYAQTNGGNQNRFEISSSGLSFGQLAFRDTAQGVEISTNGGDLLAISRKPFRYAAAPPRDWKRANTSKSLQD